MSMRRSGKDWYRNEAELMELLGFKQVPGSGSSWVAREDGENEECLCQLKSTDALSLRVHLQDIHELQLHAAVSHKLPVFAIQFRKTNEVFLLVSPEDITDVAEYIRNPFIYVKPFKEQPVSLCTFEDWVPPKSIVSSKAARDRFIKEREKKFEKKERKAR